MTIRSFPWPGFGTHSLAPVIAQCGGSAPAAWELVSGGVSGSSMRPGLRLAHRSGGGPAWRQQGGDRSVSGHRTWYRVVGELPGAGGKLPLLILHGAPASRTTTWGTWPGWQTTAGCRGADAPRGCQRARLSCWQRAKLGHAGDIATALASRSVDCPRVASDRRPRLPSATSGPRSRRRSLGDDRIRYRFRMEAITRCPNRMCRMAPAFGVKATAKMILSRSVRSPADLCVAMCA
jgi:hypothetical protein